jgi:hypothetical protein
VAYGNPKEYERATIKPQTADEAALNVFFETIAKRASEDMATMTEMTAIKIAGIPKERNETAVITHNAIKVYFIRRFLVIGLEISFLDTVTLFPPET